MQHLEELPLFPLNAVLFPYAQLQLHIFEERYRLMVNRCVELDAPFGIVLIRNGSEVGDSEPYMVGTVVRILNVHRYDDGRLDIQVQGERRFRIRQLDETQPYLVGHVEPVVELEWEDTFENRDVLKRSQEECEALVQKRFEQQGFSVRVMFPKDPTALSFTIANLLSMNSRVICNVGCVRANAMSWAQAVGRKVVGSGVVPDEAASLKVPLHKRATPCSRNLTAAVVRVGEVSVAQHCHRRTVGCALNVFVRPRCSILGVALAFCRR